MVTRAADTGVCWCRYTPSQEADELVGLLRTREEGVTCVKDRADAIARSIVTAGVDAAEALARDSSVGTGELLDRCLALRGEPWSQVRARRDMRERVRVWRMLSRGDTGAPSTPEGLVALLSEATAGEFPIYREAAVPQFRKSGIPFARGGAPFEQGTPPPGEETVAPADIEREVCHLLAFANSGSLTLEERAAATKFAFLHIHPFRDGNGHTSRMLLCRMLATEYAPLPLLSLVAVLQERRIETSEAITRAVLDRSDLAPYVLLMLESLYEAQERVLSFAAGEQA